MANLDKLLMVVKKRSHSVVPKLPGNGSGHQSKRERKRARKQTRNKYNNPKVEHVKTSNRTKKETERSRTALKPKK